MSLRKPSRVLAAAVGLAGAVLPLAAGTAQAETSTDDTGSYPASPQSSTQGADAGVATLDTTLASIMDANNGQDRPDDADGTDTQYPQPDPRFVEGPAGGLAKNGPLE